MTTTRDPRARLRLAAAGAGASLLIVLPAASVSAAPAPEPATVQVTASQIASVRPATGGWFADTGGSGGQFAVTKDGPENEAAMRLALSTTSDKVYLYNTFGPGSRPDDIPSLLNDASYDYAGTNVNFQIEVIFEPLDVAAHGPAGSSRACTPASTWYGWGLTADTDWCYTVLKWEPYVAPGTAAWTTVDLSVDTAAQSSTSRGGWVSSKNLGGYPGNVSNGQLMSDYLAQMADYEVTSFAFGAGSGTPGPAAGYVRQYTIGGTRYSFAPEAAPPAAPPVPDTTQLQELVETEGVDVAADTERFVTTGTQNTDLSKVDAALPLHGAYENWTDPSDAFADVYSYSEAVFIGTFPIVGGHVILDGADLSHLEPGVHHLLFRGQTSGTLAVVQFTVVGLAATGSENAGALAAAALLLTAAGVVLLGSRVRRARHRAA